MNRIIAWLMNPPIDGPKSTLLLRLIAGGVFFWEGLLKFVYPEPRSWSFHKKAVARRGAAYRPAENNHSRVPTGKAPFSPATFSIPGISTDRSKEKVIEIDLSQRLDQCAGT